MVVVLNACPIPALSAPSMIWSGCRDSNPGPSVPQTDALTKLRHSPSARTCVGRAPVGDATRGSEQPNEPLDTLQRAIAEVHGNRAEEQLEVPGKRVERLGRTRV